MYAIEFQTRLQDGRIEVPDQYKDKFTGQVRVILLTQEPPAGVDLIEQLLRQPVQMASFIPLTREQIHERD